MLTLSSEEKQFISRLDDLLERVEERYQEAATDFLEPRLQMVAEEYLRSRKIQRYLFCGGYEGAERKRRCFFQNTASRTVRWQKFLCSGFRESWILSRSITVIS